MGNMRKLAGQSGYDFLNRKGGKVALVKSFPIRDRSRGNGKSPLNTVAIRRRPIEQTVTSLVRSKERITSENNLTAQSSAHNGKGMSKKNKSNLDIASQFDENGGNICNINVSIPHKKLTLHQAYQASGLLNQSKSTLRQ